MIWIVLKTEVKVSFKCKILTAEVSVGEVDISNQPKCIVSIYLLEASISSPLLH